LSILNDLYFEYFELNIDIQKNIIKFLKTHSQIVSFFRRVMTKVFAIFYKQTEKSILGIKQLSLSKITDIKFREIETAVSFYLDNGLSQDEMCEKVSSNFDIPKDEVKKIAINYKKYN